MDKNHVRTSGVTCTVAGQTVSLGHTPFDWGFPFDTVVILSIINCPVP